MSRQQREAVAADTEAILAARKYRSPSGQVITVAEQLDRAVTATRLYLPEEALPAYPGTGVPCRIEVTGETTLQASARLAGEAPDEVAALNFASATSPGGGFRSGAQAQEESLARASGLVACLEAAAEFYTFHRAQRDARYSDRIIYSPGVPVFRDDTGALLSRPYPVAFLTAAAPNTGAGDPALRAEAPAILRQRAGRVLAVAHGHRHVRLVLGAWGCGVFRNDPATVAAVFAAHLRPGGAYANRFTHVVFAVLDNALAAPTRAAFARIFGGTP